MGTVLVIDDDRLLRESLIELVGDLGCTGIGAADGDKALSFFAHNSCDLIVSDVDMPDMSGFEFLARLQNLALCAAPGSTLAVMAQPPLIFISARADQQLEVAAQSAGAACLFPKPVPLSQFTQAVSALLRL